MEPQVQKERRVGVMVLLQPRWCLIDNDLTGIPFDLSNRLTIPKKIYRVLMTWGRTAGHAKPIIKTMLGRRGPCWAALRSTSPNAMY